MIIMSSSSIEVEYIDGQLDCIEILSEEIDMPSLMYVTQAFIDYAKSKGAFLKKEVSFYRLSNRIDEVLSNAENRFVSIDELVESPSLYRCFKNKK